MIFAKGKKILLFAFILCLLFSTLGITSFGLGDGKTGGEEKPLKGLCIGIDPGHQKVGNSSLENLAPGSKEKKAKVSSGATGIKSRIPEYRLALEVSLRLKTELEQLGAKVVMTREKNEIDISNKERALLLNQENCDMVIRIHANGSSNKKQSGYSILIPGPKYVGKSIRDTSKAFGLELDAVLKKKLDIPSEGIKPRNDLTGFNWSTRPVVLIEMGYLSNPTEDMKLQSKTFQENLVKGVGEALVLWAKK